MKQRDQPMIIQIYTSQTPEEGVALAKLGVDYVGITPSNRGLPGEVSDEQARLIFESIGSLATRVALTVENDLDEIAKMVGNVRPDILHLCGEPKKMVPPEGAAELKRMLPGLKIMQAIPVIGLEAIDIARSYEDAVDYFILDSYSPAIEGVGASGFTHDWSISRRIVEASRLPVILAGGLSPDNVADAIRAVRPWGVDSLTCTNFPLGNGKFRKDLQLVDQFVKNTRAVVETLDLQ
jgi:phosphoribosylanthranilate isomerase